MSGRVFDFARARILEGDNRDHLAALAENSLEACVTDPPYDLTSGKKGGTGVRSVNLESPYGRARIGTGNGAGGFMGHAWDATGIAFDPAFWAAVFRVLKPGAHLLAFGGTRTSHRMVCAIEDAGFEVRDSLAWIYGTGFPKSKDVSKAIAKAPTATPEAAAWAGYGTALKPACEPICLARKPLSGTVAATVLEHGTGALNIDGCRIGTTKRVPSSVSRTPGRVLCGMVDGSLRKATGEEGGYDPNLGRWPANVLLDQVAAAELDAQSGVQKSSSGIIHRKSERTKPGPAPQGTGTIGREFGDFGGASRFFYVAKPSRAERDAGTADDNLHPTVKPVDLMRYLVRLVTPPGGTVLDPFMGSGGTGIAALTEGFRFLGIDLTPQYVDIAKERIAAWEHADNLDDARSGQASLLPAMKAR